jgi:hypothetical protein
MPRTRRRTQRMQRTRKGRKSVRRTRKVSRRTFKRRPKRVKRQQKKRKVGGSDMLRSALRRSRGFRTWDDGILSDRRETEAYVRFLNTVSDYSWDKLENMEENNFEERFKKTERMLSEDD